MSRFLRQLFGCEITTSTRKTPQRRKLGAEDLERRSMLSADAMAPGTMPDPAIHNPVAVESAPSRPAGADLGTANSGNPGFVAAPAPGNANFVTNGPNPATSTGASVANPYLGNNPWLDQVYTMGTSTTANGSGNGSISDPLYQPYFNNTQEYAQYELAIEALAAQQAAQQLASQAAG